MSQHQTHPSPPASADDTAMTVALISEVFFDESGPDRLIDRLREARAAGADLAVLPELPLNPWSPATRTPDDSDAEPPGGERHEIQAEAAASVGIGLVGGAIVQDAETGVRQNRALIFDASGSLLSTYAKCHVPEEEGFWETDHYDPGTVAGRPIEGFPLKFGVQICSDINRPEGCHALAGMGAHAVLAPRSTEAATYDRWRIVFQANAMTSGLYVLSVNRPAPEQGVLIGGPSIAVDPRGEIMLETTDPVAVVTMSAATLADARTRYPGYLPVRADLYVDAWTDVARQ